MIGIRGKLGGAGEKKIKIGFIVKQPDEAWFQAEWKWAEKAGLKDGFEVVKVAANNQESVLSVIDDLASEG